MKPLILMAALTMSLATSVYAQSAATEQSGHQTTHTKASTMTDGEIRRIDKDGKKLTIRHGAIENLGMPPMTMVFQVKDPAMLDKVNPGDKIKFSAEKIGGAYTVTNIEPVK